MYISFINLFILWKVFRFEKMRYAFMIRTTCYLIVNDKVNDKQK